MKYLLDKGAHSVNSLQDHFVQCVKYRKKLFVDERYVTLMKNKMHEISETFEVEVINVEFDKDHFDMLF